MTSPANPPNHYIFEPFTDRERLYSQFELFKDDFNERFLAALKLGNLSANPATADWRLLDAGCGEGLYGTEILNKYPNVEIVGFDRDPEAVTTANMFIGPQGKARFFVQDILEPLPAWFKSEIGTAEGTNFDIVLTWLVLMHLKTPELALANLINSLKPGGVIILYDTLSDWAYFPHPSFQVLKNIMHEVGMRYANFDFGERHVETLNKLGMVDVETSIWDRPLGGMTKAGQLMFNHTVSTMEASRTALTERMRVMSVTEFDEHIRRIKEESTTQQEGLGRTAVTIARKPLDAK